MDAPEQYCFQFNYARTHYELDFIVIYQVIVGNYSNLPAFRKLITFLQSL